MPCLADPIEADTMNALVLIAEDEPNIAEILDAYLTREGFRTVRAGDGKVALDLHLALRPDLILLDVTMPRLDGWDVLAEVRRRGNTPVIMVTALDTDMDRLQGLRVGADDYVVKPFSLPELMARVKAILRRTSPDRVADVLKIGDIELDRAAHRVTRGLRQVRLGPTEFRLLEFLMESSGRVLSRTQLLDGVWGRDAFVDERTVDVHIGRLRKALIRGNERDPIRTVRSAGYVFGES